MAKFPQQNLTSDSSTGWFSRESQHPQQTNNCGTVSDHQCHGSMCGATPQKCHIPPFSANHRYKPHIHILPSSYPAHLLALVPTPKHALEAQESHQEALSCRVDEPFFYFSHLMAQLHLVTVPCSQMRQMIIKLLLVTEQPKSISSKFNMSAELRKIVLAHLSLVEDSLAASAIVHGILNPDMMGETITAQSAILESFLNNLFGSHLLQAFCHKFSLRIIEAGIEYWKYLWFHGSYDESPISGKILLLPTA
ncbi:hypothetical protein SADUNF_Sadunf04G0057200 [Salix dunnii]|uniref:Uncharacterized protein n=1 Tax=Salix dunnii TaxID=1413687 RepID=A0A835K8B8_9ROSI|nr:hypothetical protein SADUNF_Sadunf04G0057200 [Salix dunnii]